MKISQKLIFIIKFRHSTPVQIISMYSSKKDGITYLNLTFRKENVQVRIWLFDARMLNSEQCTQKRVEHCIYGTTGR